ncbi:MAG: polymerase subunit epsilon [Variovorax sp.]|nr:polymerase subunit epsilon [Variovorax sp.]
MSRQIVLDTETTGLSADNGDRVIELGCVELLNRKLSGNDLHIYFNPERESHEDALKVHGLTTDFLRDKPKFAAMADEIVDYLRDAELIIHNAAFDVGFLNKEFERAGLPPLRTFVAEVTDTLAMAKMVYPGKRNSLDALCDRFGVDRSNRTFHGAKLDAQLLADVYINLTRGQDALLIDVASDEPALGGNIVAVDLRSFTLPVILAAEQEIAAHEELLAQLDKSSKGKTLFRQLDLQPQNAVA